MRDKDEISSDDDVVPSKTNDGGPVFPQSKGVADRWIAEGGMTLRDHFAAKAMAEVSWSEDYDRFESARQCYSIADAMLAAREVLK